MSSRIRFRTNRTENPTPCDGFGLGMGSTEDFTIKIIEEPTCFYPTDVEIEYITDTSAWVTWTPSNEEDQWLVVYGYTGLNPDLQEGEAIEINGDNAVELTDLIPDTSYDVFVKAICDAETESYFAQAQSFTTNVAPPENTYLCDAMELGLNADCDGGPFTNVDAFQEYKEPVGSCLNVFEGVNTVWFTFVAPSNGEVVVSTDFEQTGFVAEIVVYQAPEDCEDMSTLGEEVGCANNGSELELENLTPGEIYYVRVGGFDNAVGNFCIEIQTHGTLVCLAPSSIVVDYFADDAVEVSWEPGNDETAWELVYGETGMDVDSGEGEMILVTGTPTTIIEGLEYDTEYDVYVRAICDEENTSMFTGSETFMIEVLSVDEENFQNFRYFPNPTKGKVSLKADAPIEQVTVYDLLGKKVLEIEPDTLNHELDLLEMSIGVYLMKVTLKDKSNTYRIQRVVVFELNSCLNDLLFFQLYFIK